MTFIYNNAFSKLSRRLFLLLVLSCLASCNYEKTTLDVGSSFGSVWSFSEDDNYEFNNSSIVFENGKARLKAIDLESIGSDFSAGELKESHLNSNNNLSLFAQVSFADAHVNMILPSLSSSLLGYWRFDGDFSDSSGNANHGVPENGVITTSEQLLVGSGALKVIDDGSGQGVRVAYNASNNLHNSLSYSFWIRPLELGGVSSGTRSTVLQTAYGAEFAANMSDDGSMHFYHGACGGECTPYAQPEDQITHPLLINQWDHLVVTFNKTTLEKKIYQNGELIRSRIEIVDSSSSTRDILIGNGYTGPMNGYLDEVAIWSDVLSAQDVALLYQKQKKQDNSLSRSWAPAWEDLIGYWKLDENWLDSSTHQANLTPHVNSSFAANAKVGDGALSVLLSDSYAYIDDPVDGHLDPSSITMSAWIKPDSSVTSGNIICKNTGYRLALRPGNSIRFYENSYADDVQVSGVAPYEAWTHVVATGSTDGLKIYINGELKVSSPNVYDGLDDAGRFYIGICGYGERFIGLIDDVALWGSELSPAQINEIYQNQKQKYRGHYESEVFNVGAFNEGWADWSWSTPLPFGKELVGDGDGDGNVDSEIFAEYSDMSAAMNEGLLLYFPFNINDIELTGKSLTSTSVPSTISAGVANEAAHFDGLNNNYVVNDDLGNPTELTLSLWYLDLGTQTNWRYIADARDNGNWWFAVYQADHRIDFNGLFSGATKMPIGEWTHLVVTADSLGTRLYMNGQLMQSAGPTTLGIGSGLELFSTNGGEVLNGYVDEYAIWNRALSATEVLQLFQRPTSRVTIQLKSCVDEACNCKSYSSLPEGQSNDCDGDGIVNELDALDIHRAVYMGPGGDSTTYYSENYNRRSSDINMNCGLNTSDASSSVCVLDEINLSGSAQAGAPEFFNSNYPQFVKPQPNPYVRYKVFLEAEDNSSCSGGPCLPELTSVNLNPTGEVKYFGGAQIVEPSTPLDYKSISSVQVDADDCVKYQLSPSGNENDYHYWDGSAWALATDDNVHLTDKEDFENHILSYVGQQGPGQLYLKAYLFSNADQTAPCELSDIDFIYEN